MKKKKKEIIQWNPLSLKTKDKEKSNAIELTRWGFKNLPEKTQSEVRTYKELHKKKKNLSKRKLSDGSTRIIAKRNYYWGKKDETENSTQDSEKKKKLID